MDERHRPVNREPFVYRITVEGRLDPRWSEWFNDMTIAFDPPTDGSPIITVIGTAADQTKLRGILSRLWDLNLTVISVTRAEQGTDESRSNQGGHAWENS